nr:MAG TPA: hypothetical protein [Caudoviricetes sp.]
MKSLVMKPDAHGSCRMKMLVYRLALINLVA